MTTALSVRLGAGLLAVTAAAFVAIQATSAAFTSQTDNTANQFDAGTVVLTDDDSGSALFDGSSLYKPGFSEVGCIEVTYSGSLDSEVHLFGAVAGGDGLEAYLDLKIERGDGDCTTFGTATTIWDTPADGDLGVFLASANDFASGIDNWSPTGGGPNDMVPYRFTITLQDDNAAQGLSATVDFTFEAQNT